MPSFRKILGGLWEVCRKVLLEALLGVGSEHLVQIIAKRGMHPGSAWREIPVSIFCEIIVTLGGLGSLCILALLRAFPWTPLAVHQTSLSWARV